MCKVTSSLTRAVVSRLLFIGFCVFVYFVFVERNAQAGNSGAVKSVIFPIFTKMMWLSAFSSVLLALLMIFVPVHLTHGPNEIVGEKLTLYLFFDLL
jgi:hypothetical protein